VFDLLSRILGAGLLCAALLSSTSCSTPTNGEPTSTKEESPGSTGVLPFIDSEKVGSWVELARSARLIVVGRPIGEVKSRTVAGGQAADYEQAFAIASVLRGSRDLDTVTVVRIGLSGPEPSGGPPGHIVLGPLESSEQILFLQPGGREGTWAVVGHSQGSLKVVDGVVTDSELQHFEGMSVEQIRKLANSERASRSRAEHP
jgi:hypothetical protein